ncbi:hypothetical protein [Roseisalinus antarcticus]|uniref:hypothetical protein n=1 Tax=Roseisalinus antarcticus TaxID=254357 RepID=UPI000A267361|nr:hypothetical protein [Roseisalinus antarcticus]
MSEVFVHAGFHKTGTSSLQDYLRRHRARLAADLRIALPEDMAGPVAAGLACGRAPLAWRRRRFGRALAAWFACQPRDGRPLFMSWEGFAGLMPGHRDALGRTVRTYGMALPMARAILNAALRGIGPETRVSFLYTTRDQASWARSVHGHILRSRRLTEDEARFRHRLAPLGPTLAALLAGLPVPVHEIMLEEAARHRLGPAGPALMIAGLPEARLAALPRAPVTNRGDGADLRAAYLSMNRKTRDRPALAQAKAAMGKAHG